MLNASRALSLNADSGRPLPRVPALQRLYDWGCTPRHGEVVMIAGRSGTQKSGFALWLVDEWALPTLYFSADMSAFTASSRLASKRGGLTTDEVEAAMKAGGDDERRVLEAVSGSNITFAFGSPITWQRVEDEVDAFVELWDTYPAVVVFDNLMDFEGAESDYTEQMAVMSGVTEFARETGATVLILHHATDKSAAAEYDPTQPPSRREVKGGLSEKPELSLSVAIDTMSAYGGRMPYRIAVIKQRMGPSDPSARRYAVIECEPALTRFHHKQRV